MIDLNRYEPWKLVVTAVGIGAALTLALWFILLSLLR